MISDKIFRVNFTKKEEEEDVKVIFYPDSQI